MLDRVRDALGQMKREHAKGTVAAVARRADVSRTFLYQNVEARKLINEWVANEHDRRGQARSADVARIESSWRERALNAEDGLKAAHNEILAQRNTIAELAGKVRDLEADIPEDGIQRLVTENTTLKHQIRQFTNDIKRFQDRLHAARDNNRFLDNRIAELEAELSAHPNGTPRRALQ
jgi:chromosome segregation ATPase